VGGAIGGRCWLHSPGVGGVQHDGAKGDRTASHTTENIMEESCYSEQQQMFKVLQNSNNVSIL